MCLLCSTPCIPPHQTDLFLQDLFLAIDKYLLVPNTRFQALGLLAAFVEQQQAHLYLVSQTDVVDHLLTCLMNDTATVVVSAALRCLIMLLPHMPATVVAQLPRLFLIYSRCLCWEKFSASSTKAQRDLVTDERVRRGSGSEYSDESDDDSDLTWPTLHASPDMPESSAPELLHYFTYLYGLYPLNLMSYVRKPRKYLKNIDYPGADHFDLDQAVIRSRTEQFQRVHLLHPALFNTTVEDELVDNRWLKAEPSEVIAECHALYVGQQNLVAPGPPPTVSLPSLPGPPPITSLPSLPVLPALSPSNTRNQTSQSGSRPTSPATSTTSPTRTRQHGTTLLPRESSVLSATDDQSQHDLLDVEGSSTTGGAVPPNKLTTIESTTTLQDVNQLQRELMLLRNELTFERYLKHQHVAAIGQLRRNHIKAVTIEAETATLINANRALQKKLGDAIKFNEKMQKETQARRTHTKQSEELLTTKIRSLKADLADQESIQLKLKQVTKDCEQLRQLLVESEARELGKNKELEQRQTELKQQQEGIEQLQAKAQEAESLRSELSELSRQIRMHRQFEAQIETTRAEQEMTLQELDSVKLLLMHRDQELDRSTRQFQTKTVELETRLQIAQSQAVNSTSINELQAALDDTRFELMQTKKAYTQLLNDYTYIKIKYQELADASCLGLETQSIHSMLPRDPSFSCDYRSQASRVRNQSPMGSRNQHYPDRVLEQVDMYEPQRGHLPPPSSSGNFVPTRPVRPDAYQQQHVVNPGTLSHSSYSSSAALGDSYLYPPAAYNAARSMLGSDYGLMPPAMVRDGRKSAFSVSEDGHSSIENDKIKAKSEVRVYGRGK